MKSKVSKHGAKRPQKPEIDKPGISLIRCMPGKELSLDNCI